MEEEVFGLITRLSNYVTRKEAQVSARTHYATIPVSY
jgi:hypothetical protein